MIDSPHERKLVLSEKKLGEIVEQAYRLNGYRLVDFGRERGKGVLNGSKKMISVVNTIQALIINECEATPSDPLAVEIAPAEVRLGLQRILTRIGSWTSSRWDQHLREFMGDERTNSLIKWLAARGIMPYIPEDVGGRRLQMESVVAGVLDGEPLEDSIGHLQNSSPWERGEKP